MRHGRWDHEWGGGWLLPRFFLILAFIGVFIWIGISLARRAALAPPGTVSASPPSPARTSPQEILAERLARGEIEPDDYRHRLEMLTSPAPGTDGP